MLKSVYSVFCMVVFLIQLLLVFPFVLLILLLPNKQKIIAMHHLLQGFAYVWFTIIGIRTKFFNDHLLKETGSSIIIPNHSSYLDAAINYRAIDAVFLTLGKIEISKAPLFGLIYKTATVMIDRSTVMTRAKSFLKMTAVLKEGIDILIFPEGTFDEFDSDLKPFFDGAFRLALHSKKPLLPLLYVDARQRMHPSSLMSFTPGVSRIVYLPPIQTTGLPNGCEKELSNYVYDYMNTILNFCRDSKNNCGQALDKAKEWLAQNPLVIEPKKK
jgi:1-acyl-sn-glycerol-3-phosphate acyltransferase